ncbi:MAG: hypothetical protein HGA44_21815, partial [Cellulomonadaceae bacterium]|nr:hypothetical protein [Cellulomonadaceae bacterium]
MSGDLGNLLTGELGEAEARFSHEDFAADFGQRIASRVRRRRAVRAAGVGGGTMLTAGALVVGATHMPWGVLGAAPGVGVSDCVTPSPSDGAHLVTVTVDGSDARSGEMVVTDAATGGVRLRGIQQADGTWRVTDADGNPVEATSGPGGGYVVSLDGASVGIEWPDAGASAVSSDPSTAGSFTYTVTEPDGDAPVSPSDDCYTPSPTTSVVPSVSTEVFASTDPSLAAKPEDVMGDSPFECGFEFPTASHGTDDLWIDGVEWFTPAEVEAARAHLYGTDAATDLTSSSATVPRVTVHRVDKPLAEGQEASGVMGTWDPSLEKVANLALGGISAERVSAEGLTFVGVVGDKVVATGTLTEGDDRAQASVLRTSDYGGEALGELMYLVDPSVALTSCDVNP